MYEGLDITPSLKGNALEHTENCVPEVVKIGDPVIWILNSFATIVSSRALEISTNDIIRVMNACVN